MTQTLSIDVVVVGSGAGGMLAAIRAKELGLNPLLIEKSDRYGGTTAVSGGAIWIPNNDDIRHEDTPEKALEYLKAVTENLVPEAKLKQFIQTAPEIPRYLKKLGIHYYSYPTRTYPDYYPFAPGALTQGRNMFVKPMNGTVLGDEFFRMREAYPEIKLMEGISLDYLEGSQLSIRAKGWFTTVLRLLFNYWKSIGWRFKTYRDKRLTLGNALSGGLRKVMLDMDIPLLLNTRLTKLITDNGRVTGIIAERHGQQLHIHARKGVVLASGGFEQSRELRNKYFDQPTEPHWSATPLGCNTGDGLLAAQEIGADTEFMNEAWWAPTIPTPSPRSPNIVRNFPLFIERGFPHSLTVNRLGQRFTDEIRSYHQFSQAMLRDNAANGKNMPCWIIFDARFRKKYALGGLLPADMMPDKKLPPNWLDSFLFRADTIRGLAEKIGVPGDALEATIERFNDFARKGVDEDFGRGGNFYCEYFGDPAHKPNQVLGEVSSPPYYAVRLDLGDIGSKGGPKTDEKARVLDKTGQPIKGLYAVGNVAGSVMGPAYPGAGATLGAALTFAYLAAADLAETT